VPRQGAPRIPTRRFARDFRSFLSRFAERRVDFRDGLPVPESSSRYAADRAARLDAFLVAVERGPTLRSDALTPGSAVSTGEFLGRFGGAFGRFGPERSAW
jgi:hypothetical protein